MGQIAEGLYELQLDLTNELGDGRASHNGCPLRKKGATLERGFRFRVHGENLCSVAGKKAFWLQDAQEEEWMEKSDRKRAAKQRAFIERLLASSVKVETTPEEEFRFRYHSYAGNGFRMLQAALNLGLDKETLFAEFDRLLRE